MNAQPGGYLGTEGTPYYGGHLLHNLLLFGRVCKSLGMNVTPNRMMDVAQALEYVRLGRRDDFYHALRALIVTSQRDLALFEEAFQRFWQVHSDEGLRIQLASGDEPPRPDKPRILPNPEVGLRNSVAADDDLSEPQRTDIVVIQTYSRDETLRYRDFALMTGEELAEAWRIMARFEWGLGWRKTRRLITGKGDLLDLRRTFRKNLRFAGETVVLPTRMPKIKPRPLVLLCDISGSMERYTRLLLHFMHTLAHSMFQVESFVFSTRLTRITRQLRHKSIDRTLQSVGLTVNDWGGGTRTGDVLHEFNYRWARRVLGRGAVIVLITDGWDRGDPACLEHEMDRLRRNAYRVMWLNPLLGGKDYEPLTRGAQAMLPYVDDFLPVHNLHSLDMLAKTLHRLNGLRPSRKQVVQWANRSSIGG